jgi:Family of unknown function (DUF6263)
MSLNRRVALAIGLGLCLTIPTGKLHSEDSAVPAKPVAAADAPEKYQLVFKFKPNQILRYEVINEQEFTTSAREEKETHKNSTHSKRHHLVASVDEKTGIANLELAIDWVSMRALWDKHDGSTPIPTEFQSDDPEKQSEKFKQVKATIGKPWATIQFRTTGSPVKVLSSAVKSNETKTVATETGADGALEAYLIVLPDHPVAVGESWKEKFDILTMDENRNRQTVTLQRVYKLKSVADGKAVIDMRTIILSPMTNPSIAAQLLLREITGKVVFDMDRGLILSKEWTAENRVVNPIPGIASLMEGNGRYLEKLIGEEEAPGKTTASTAGSTVK